MMPFQAVRNTAAKRAGKIQAPVYWQSKAPATTAPAWHIN